MDADPLALPPGAVEVAGQVYLRDAKGSLVPIEVVRDQDRLQDDLVRRLFASASSVAKLLVEFKVNAFGDIDAFNDLLAGQYKTSVGGEKGNISLITFDGLFRVQVQVSDQLEFGPELQVAKTIIDKCVVEWAAGSGKELRTIVAAAFQADKQGQINRGRLFTLLRYDIADPRWLEAMKALRDSIRVIGSKRYIRFYSRASAQAPWIPLSLDAATA